MARKGLRMNLSILADRASPDEWAQAVAIDVVALLLCHFPLLPLRLGAFA